MRPVAFARTPSFGHYLSPAERGVCVRLYGLPKGVQVQIRDRRFWYANGNREGTWKQERFLEALNEQFENLGVGLKAVSPLPDDTIFVVASDAPEERVEGAHVFAMLSASRRDATWSLWLDFREDGGRFVFTKGTKETVCGQETTWFETDQAEGKNADV